MDHSRSCIEKGCHASFFDRLVGSGLGRILEAGEVGHHCNRFYSLPSVPQQLCFVAKERVEGLLEGERAFMTAQYFAAFRLNFTKFGNFGGGRKKTPKFFNTLIHVLYNSNFIFSINYIAYSSI